MNLRKQKSGLRFRSFHYTVIDATEVIEFPKEDCVEWQIKVQSRTKPWKHQYIRDVYRKSGQNPINKKKIKKKTYTKLSTIISVLPLDLEFTSTLLVAATHGQMWKLLSIPSVKSNTTNIKNNIQPLLLGAPQYNREKWYRNMFIVHCGKYKNWNYMRSWYTTEEEVINSIWRKWKLGDQKIFLEEVMSRLGFKECIGVGQLGKGEKIL